VSEAVSQCPRAQLVQHVWLLLLRLPLIHRTAAHSISTDHHVLLPAGRLLLPPLVLFLLLLKDSIDIKLDLLSQQLLQLLGHYAMLICEVLRELRRVVPLPDQDVGCLSIGTADVHCDGEDLTTVIS